MTLPREPGETERPMMLSQHGLRPLDMQRSVLCTEPCYLAYRTALPLPLEAGWLPGGQGCRMSAWVCSAVSSLHLLLQQPGDFNLFLTSRIRSSLFLSTSIWGCEVAPEVHFCYRCIYGIHGFKQRPIHLEWKESSLGPTSANRKLIFNQTQTLSRVTTWAHFSP